MRDSWRFFNLTPGGWVLVTLGVLLIGVAAVNWSSRRHEHVATVTAEGSAAPAMPLASPPTAVAATPATIALCNRYAAGRIGHKDMRALAIEGHPSESIFAGALYGMDQSRGDDERYRLAYGSCMRVRGYR